MFLSLRYVPMALISPMVPMDMRSSKLIPVFSNLGQASGCDEKVAKSLEFDMRAANLYSILAGNGRIGEDKKQIPYILGMKR